MANPSSCGFARRTKLLDSSAAMDVTRILDPLNDAQREAVTAPQEPMLVVAGAGSGKTRVVTHRVAWLLKQGIAGREILALTFTNKAAEEMQNRVVALTGGRGQGVVLSTFHRFCAQLLRREGAAGRRRTGDDAGRSVDGQAAG